MCLWSIDKETKQVSEGWKVFEIIDNKLYGTYIPYIYKTNRWIKDNRCGFIQNIKHMIYETGFHFYLNKEDAMYHIYKNNPEYKFKIYKVKVRKIVATGIRYIQLNKVSVGVAREIFIEEE